MRPPGKPRKARKKAPGVHLKESGEHDGFRTYEVLAGQRGVCEAPDDRDYTRHMDIDQVQRLAMAAKVLAAILQEREEV